MVNKTRSRRKKSKNIRKTRRRIRGGVIPLPNTIDVNNKQMFLVKNVKGLQKGKTIVLVPINGEEEGSRNTYIILDKHTSNFMDQNVINDELNEKYNSTEQQNADGLYLKKVGNWITQRRVLYGYSGINKLSGPKMEEYYVYADSSDIDEIERSANDIVSNAVQKVTESNFKKTHPETGEEILYEDQSIEIYSHIRNWSIEPKIFVNIKPHLYFHKKELEDSYPEWTIDKILQEIYNEVIEYATKDITKYSKEIKEALKSMLKGDGYLAAKQRGD